MSVLFTTMRCLFLAMFVFLAIGGENLCASHDHCSEDVATASMAFDCACLCHAPSIPQLRLSAPPVFELADRVSIPANQSAPENFFPHRIFQPPRSI